MAAASARPCLRVVRQPGSHQQAPQVGVAQPQRPELVAVGRDPVGRVARVVDQDLLRRDEDPHRRAKPLGVEAAVVAAELHQVDRRQVACRIVDEHVFAARIGRIDRRGIGASVPALNRVFVLQAGVAAKPGSQGDLVHELRALKVSIGRPVVTARVVQSPSASTALKNESVQRTDRLAF